MSERASYKNKLVKLATNELKCKTCVGVSWVKGRKEKGLSQVGRRGVQHIMKRKGEVAGGFGEQRPL